MENLSISVSLKSAQIKSINAPSFWNIHATSKLYCITMIIEDYNDMLKGYICIDPYTGVTNNEFISLYRPLYLWQGTSLSDAPDRIIANSIIVKEKRTLLAPATVIENMKSDDNYLALADTLTSLVSSTVSFAHMINISMAVLDVITRNIMGIQSPSLAATAVCFSKHFGDMGRLGTSNVYKSTRAVDFEYEMMINYNTKPDHTYLRQPGETTGLLSRIF